MKHRIMLVLIAVLAISAHSVCDAAVQYMGADTDTKGDWVGKYGNNGVILFAAADMEELKDITVFDDGGNNRWDWENPSDDVRGVLYTDGSGQRSGSCMYNNPEGILTVETSLSAYQVAFYACDWDSTVRIQTLTGYQGDAPADPDVTVENPVFNEGVYHIWNVTDGPFSLRVTHEGGANWVLSGLFVDGMDSASVEPSSKLATTWGQLKN